MDFVARRYGKLPSQVLDVGWSIDVECANIGAGYEAFLQKRANGESTTPEPTQEELLAMMERVREGKRN